MTMRFLLTVTDADRQRRRTLCESYAGNWVMTV
jgi:hypothetical protein